MKHKGDQSKKNQTIPTLSQAAEAHTSSILIVYSFADDTRQGQPLETKRNEEFLTLHYVIDYAKKLI